MTKDNLNYSDSNNLLHEICYHKGDFFYPQNRISALERLFANSNSALDINCIIDGYTALGIASSKSDEQIVEFLLNNGADPNLPDEKGRTPLMIATDDLTFSKTICKMLLNRGANTDITDQDGNTVLMNLINRQSLRIIESFPNSSINFQNKDGNTALIIACKNLGKVSSVTLSTRVPTAKMVNQDIVSNQIIEILLKNGADPLIKNQQGQNSLMSLCGKINYYNAYQLTEFAVQHRLIRGKKVESGTLRYFLADEEEKLLYKESAEKELIVGASNKVRNAINLLLSHGVALNEKDNSGKTALEIARNTNDEILFEELSKAGANEYDIKRKQFEYKYLIDKNDYRNISNEISDDWYNFAQLITESVKNKTHNIANYPQVNLNEDNSISFFFEDDYMAQKKLKEFLSQEYLIEQFKFHAQEYGFNCIGGEEILQITPHKSDNMTEYKFNLSPENFDTIMKLNPQYVGYRNDNNILKLNKSFSLKDDVIMLFPIFRINDTEFAVRVAGCQFFEMPTLQLMKLLPNYEDEILPEHQEKGFRFHWIPEEVKKALCLDREDFISILEKVFSWNGILVTENSQDFAENPDLLTINDSTKQSAISIVAMSDVSKDFYAMYGNCSFEELQNCESLEIKTITLLQAISEHLDKKVLNEEYQAQINTAKETIAKMIEHKRRPDIKAKEVPNPSPQQAKVDVKDGCENFL